MKFLILFPKKNHTRTFKNNPLTRKLGLSRDWKLAERPCPILMCL